MLILEASTDLQDDHAHSMGQWLVFVKKFVSILSADTQLTNLSHERT